MVFVHGAAADGRVWRPQPAGLEDEFTVVAWGEQPERFNDAVRAFCRAHPPRQP